MKYRLEEREERKLVLEDIRQGQRVMEMKWRKNKGKSRRQKECRTEHHARTQMVRYKEGEEREPPLHQVGVPVLLSDVVTGGSSSVAAAPPVSRLQHIKIQPIAACPHSRPS